MNFFQNDGYLTLFQIIDTYSINFLKAELDRHTQNKEIYAIRDLHLKITAIANIAKSPKFNSILFKHVKQQQFKLIKAIFFHKNQQHNWAVPWHQDKTIAVKQKVTIPGYKNWTVKQGVPHVQPPLDILEKITTIRIALDDCNSQNGALKIVPKTHKLGILQRSQIERIVKANSPVTCSLQAGDVLLMHPLVLHSSAKSTSDRDRRVIHLEYSSAELPPDL